MASSQTLALLAQLPLYEPGQHTMCYAGIGSRKTPEVMQAKMCKVAERLFELGYCLRSGHALGADQAFELGAHRRKEIFYANHAEGHQLAQRLMEAVHPNPGAMGAYARNLMARNAFQVFGAQLDTPVDFVLCWTPDGCENHQTRTRETGGTGQAISLASLRGIPVINMRNEGWAFRVKELVERN